MREIVCRTFLAIVVLGFSCRSWAISIPSTFNIVLDRQAQPTGPALYEIQVIGLNTFQESAIGPTGRVYQLTQPVSNLTSEQALAEIVGNWKINSAAPNLPGQPLQLHEFSIAPFSFDSLFTVSPTIVSPTDGSILTSPFTMSWAWPTGVTPPGGKSARSRGGAAGARLDWTSLSGNAYLATVSFTGSATQASYALRAGSFQSLNSFVSPVTTSVSDPFRSYTAMLGHSSLSLPIQVMVVVPEPTAIVLIASGGLAAFFRCRAWRIESIR